jgi:hypothetical protein
MDILSVLYGRVWHVNLAHTLWMMIHGIALAFHMLFD